MLSLNDLITLALREYESHGPFIDYTPVHRVRAWFQKHGKKFKFENIPPAIMRDILSISYDALRQTPDDFEETKDNLNTLYNTIRHQYGIE